MFGLEAHCFIEFSWTEWITDVDDVDGVVDEESGGDVDVCVVTMVQGEPPAPGAEAWPWSPSPP